MNPINNKRINDTDLNLNKYNKNQNKSLQEKNEKIIKQKEKINTPVLADKKLDRQIESLGNNEAEALDLEIIKREKSNKQTSISEKSEGLYNCIGRKKDKSSGGYFYIFELKNEFKNLKKQEEINIFHAVIRELYPATQVPPIVFENLGDIFKKLGYEKKGDCFILPDEKILNSRWLNIIRDNPNLLPLNVISSNGIADDKSYIEAIIQGNIILSNGPEFLHDHFFHVMQRILLLSKHGSNSMETHSSNYLKIFTKFNKDIQKIISLINEKEMEAKNPQLNEESKKEQEKICEILWTCLGLIVDKASACETLNDLRSFPGEQLVYILLFDKPYFIKRYGEFIENNKEKLSVILNKMYEDSKSV
ncbi:MAG: hypothetical protein Q8K60_07585 [Parachlamydiaceae bacterium]|nr:hypothetical protein [Parachlamydiaceae bacterium]